jgi:hypothetical protein
MDDCTAACFLIVEDDFLSAGDESEVIRTFVDVRKR